jgi:LacI family transcriptional regulator
MFVTFFCSFLPGGREGDFDIREVSVKRPTIKDVARQSGFSLSTVSLAINQRGYVSPDTRSKILKVVEDLSYHPTRSARGLASKTSGNIGFILTEDHFSAAEPFYTKIFLGTEFEARMHHYYILLTTVEDEFEAGATPRFLLERNVDGVIIAGKVSPKLIDRIETFGIPIVLVDYELKRKRFSAVLIDNRGGMRAGMQHLFDLGHRAIAFVAGDVEHPSIAERYQGYREMLEEHGIPPARELVSIDSNEPRVSTGAAAVEKMLSRGARPTAVVAANDAMAIGCMQYLKQAGIRIPEDVSVMGFDDIDTCAVTEPRLTSIRVFKEEMGRLAVQRIVEMIASKSQTVVTTQVPVELVIRDSTSAPSAGSNQAAREGVAAGEMKNRGLS